MQPFQLMLTHSEMVLVNIHSHHINSKVCESKTKQQQNDNVHIRVEQTIDVRLSHGFTGSATLSMLYTQGNTHFLILFLIIHTKIIYDKTYIV